MTGDDNLLLLPVDILVLIFRKVALSDLRNLMLTCKTLRDMIQNDNRIWRSFIYNRTIIRDKADSRWFDELSWYNRCKASMNWNNGCYKIKSLIRHHTNYMPWMQFYKSEFLLLSVGSDLFAYRSDDKGIPNTSRMLWKIEVPKVLRQGVRTNDISRFVLKDDVLACGNRDGCVAIYKVSTLDRKPLLKVHIKDCHEQGQVEVSAVETIECREQINVWTASADSPGLLMSTLKMRTSPTQNSHHSLKYIPIPSCAGAKCLCLNSMGDKLAIGLKGNGQPILLDISTAQFLSNGEATMHHRQAVRDVQWHDNNTVVFVTHSGFLQLIDIRTQQVVYKTRDPFQSTLYCVKSDGENSIMAGSAEYSRCVLFDARQDKFHMQMYFTQRNTSPVYCLEFDSTKLITAVDRGVAVLNFNIDPAGYEKRDYSAHVFR